MINLFKVGEITHYYEKIGVAIVELDNTLAVGDKIKFAKDGSDLFTQSVESIQVEHEKRDSAGRGEVVGLKVNEAVKPGTEIYKI